MWRPDTLVSLCQDNSPTRLPDSWEWVSCWNFRGGAAEAGEERTHPFKVVFLDLPGPDRLWVFCFKCMKRLCSLLFFGGGGTKPLSPFSAPLTWPPRPHLILGPVAVKVLSGASAWPFTQDPEGRCWKKRESSHLLVTVWGGHS